MTSSVIEFKLGRILQSSVIISFGVGLIEKWGAVYTVLLHLGDSKVVSHLNYTFNN